MLINMSLNTPFYIKKDFFSTLNAQFKLKIFYQIPIEMSSSNYTCNTWVKKGKTNI